MYLSLVILAGSVSESERSVPALTGLPRSEWAAILQQHFSKGINADNLSIIHKAAFMVSAAHTDAICLGIQVEVVWRADLVAKQS